MLIIGAGVVGLTLAIMLASQGYDPNRARSDRTSIDVTLCDKNEETRSKQICPLLLSCRTMEIYTALGLADEIHKESER